MSAPLAAPPAKRWRLELRDPLSGKGKTLAVGLGAQAVLHQQAPVACGDSTQKTPLDSKCSSLSLEVIDRITFLTAPDCLVWNWSCSSFGYESPLYCFCIYVAYLGQVHSLIDSTASICLPI
nr:protein transport protein Sec61 subunit beta isoform X1 [Chrysemys picta bellii]